MKHIDAVAEVWRLRTEYLRLENENYKLRIENVRLQRRLMAEGLAVVGSLNSSATYSLPDIR